MIFGSEFVKGLRERDGIPDLRRAARFRYTSVSPLEVGLHAKTLVEYMHDGLRYCVANMSVC